jgi:hypothetical protein
MNTGEALQSPEMIVRALAVSLIARSSPLSRVETVTAESVKSDRATKLKLVCRMNWL